MKYEDFEKFVREECMYETIYDDSDGRRILVIRLLDAYSMTNKKEWVGLTDDELQKLRKQVEELTELFHLQSQRAMDYAGMAMRKREWVGLEETEIEALRHIIDWTADWSYRNFARAIETKLKDKNYASS